MLAVSDIASCASHLSVFILCAHLNQRILVIRQSEEGVDAGIEIDDEARWEEILQRFTLHAGCGLASRCDKDVDMAALF